MGGLGSGISSTRSLVGHCDTIDLSAMIRCGQVRDGLRGVFCMRYVNSGQRIRVYYDLRDPDEASLELNYRQYFRADVQPEIAQFISLTVTRPHFGGRRWWMICPCKGRRVAKLYKPRGGNTFACREEWDLAYESQRCDGFGRAFARLGRLERQLEHEQQRTEAAVQRASGRKRPLSEGIMENTSEHSGSLRLTI